MISHGLICTSFRLVCWFFRQLMLDGFNVSLTPFSKWDRQIAVTDALQKIVFASHSYLFCRKCFFIPDSFFPYCFYSTDLLFIHFIVTVSEHNDRELFSLSSISMLFIYVSVTPFGNWDRPIAVTAVLQKMFFAWQQICFCKKVFQPSFFCIAFVALAFEAWRS